MRKVTPGIRPDPEDRSEVLFASLPVKRRARVQDFPPAGGCRRLDRGLHGPRAWEWLREVVGPMPKLPPALRRSVLRYTGDHYHQINQAMVDDRGSALVMLWVGQMREALALSCLPVPLRLYRSSSPRWLHQKGERFRADHLISTSPDPRVATAWAPAQPYVRRTLWAIDAPVGAHAIWGMPNNRDQAEVLLAEGTRFVVREVLRNLRGDAHMHLVVAPSDQSPE